MTSKLTYMGAIGLTALSSVAAVPAFAAGTTAGTTITNTATVDYQVGGVAQGQQSASNNFTVDRKINLLVEEVADLTTPVVPGQANAVTTRSEEHTSELQSLMRTSYAVLCLNKNNKYQRSSSHISYTLIYHFTYV